MNGFVLTLRLLIQLLTQVRESQILGSLVWLLALVFFWSGSAKLAKPVIAAGAIVDFGISRRLVPALGTASGFGEVALGVAMLATERLGLLLAASALWLFVYLIGRSLLLGKRHACACFGDTNSIISRWTLLRSLVLAAMATGLMLDNPRVHLWDPLAMYQATIAAALLGTGAMASYLPQFSSWVDEYARPVRGRDS